jgi:hypothetical protein
MEDGVVEVAEDAGEREETLYAPEEKFANPRDHMGRTAVDVKTLCDKTVECRCPECEHKLIVRSGEKVSVHFAHAPGRKDTSCKGGFETPWHKAAKLAAGSRQNWLHEYTDKTARHSRFDAYNELKMEAFEAVHSLSETYAEKQRSLLDTGISCKWLFDSAGDFANRNPLPIDIDQAMGGVLECHDLLSKKAIGVIHEIGPERCFLHYLGLAWEWVGEDRWKCLSPYNDMQALCTMEGGVNWRLIQYRARADMPTDKCAFRNGDLVSTAWQEISPGNLVATIQQQSEQLLESWRRIKRNQQYARRKRASRQYRPSTESDVASRARPVCEVLAERAALTRLLDDHDLGSNVQPIECNGHTGEDPLRRIHRTWAEYLESRGYRVKGANHGP